MAITRNPPRQTGIHLVANLQDIVDTVFGSPDQEVRPGPNQCHDITLYPEIGMAGGACEGYGLLLDIRDPANPLPSGCRGRLQLCLLAFGLPSTTTVPVWFFTDEWGGGTQAKCRANDPMEWGANALFSIEKRPAEIRELFQKTSVSADGYRKLRSPQRLAHTPVPGRDIMVQG